MDWRRLVTAVLRRKWLVIAFAALGVAGAVGVWRSGTAEYVAQGHLWVNRPESPQSGPISQTELFQSYAWLDLLRSYAVLDTVVIREKLYLQFAPADARILASLTLEGAVQPGVYVLGFDSTATHYWIAQKDVGILETGIPTDTIGRSLGVSMVMDPTMALVGREAEFRLMSPRDAARSLRDRLSTGMDRLGTFITVELAGGSAEQVASVVNAIMDRHVELATVLKRAKLDETNAILKEQLDYVQEELQLAENQLEQFRVSTITLPSEGGASPIAPGLEITRDPVFANFFRMKIELEALRRDRERLQNVLVSSQRDSVRLGALEVLANSRNSTQLRTAVQRLSDARAQYQSLRLHYTDEYPDVVDAASEVRSLETNVVPRLVRDLLVEVQGEEAQLEATIDTAAADLASIPPRSIEEAQLVRRAGIADNLYRELRQRYEASRLAALSSVPDVQVLDRAAVPQFPSSDDRTRLAILLLVGSMGAGVVGSIVLDRIDPRVRYPGQVQKGMGLPILATIPRYPGEARRSQEVDGVVEAFRELRVSLSYRLGSSEGLHLTVTSPEQGDGKTSTVVNLALAFAEMGLRTVLVDGDTRRGDAHTLLDRRRKPGLTDYLLGEDLRVQETLHPRLRLISAGSRVVEAPELLASGRCREMMRELRATYDVVLVDSPPLAAGSDAAVLGALTDHLMVVLRIGATDHRLASAKLERLEKLPVEVIGAVLNDVPTAALHYRHYTRYASNYAVRAGDAEVGRARPLVAGGR